MKTKLSPEEQRILLGNFTPEERKNVRRTEEWETCFQSWLASATPSEIQERLEGPEEEFLEWMDQKALQLVKAMKLDDREETEALKELFPYPEDWEERADDPLPPDLQKRAMSLLNRVQE